MMAKILPKAVILTRAHRTTVSITAKGSIVALILPPLCFLLLLPNYTNILVFFFYLPYLMMSLKYSS